MEINNLKDFTVLNNGLKMPWLGFGVFKVSEGNEVEQAVKTALEVGYRSIDTTAVYGNERGVGKALKESGIPRNEIFLTTEDRIVGIITSALCHPAAMTLWYDHPASEWMEALPIGNGRLGAMVYSSGRWCPPLHRPPGPAGSSTTRHRCHAFPPRIPF